MLGRSLEGEEKHQSYQDGEDPFDCDSQHYETGCKEHDRDLLMKIHCQPEIPRFPSNLMIPDAKSGLKAFPPNMPKKKMATLLASSFFVYHVDRVYTAPGIYPASASPRNDFTTRKPVRLVTVDCSVAMRPNARIWAGM